MLVLNNFLQAIAGLLDTLLSIYVWIIIISVILTWVNPDPHNPIVRILNNLTEPVFRQVRKLLPFTVIGGIDLSPIVVLILVEFVKMFLVKSLYQIGMPM